MHDTRHNPYAWAVSVIATVFAVGNIGLGWVLLAAPQRLRGVSFTYILHVAPAWLWGAGFVTSGAVALFGQYTHRLYPARLAHTASAVACIFWAVAFAYAAFAPGGEGVSLTGVIAYGVVIGVTHAVLAVVTPHE